VTNPLSDGEASFRTRVSADHTAARKALRDDSGNISDRVDFDPQPFQGQPSNLNGCPRGPMFAEHPCVHGIHSWEFGDVGHKNAAAQDVLEA
jgi:hypothetical protein